MSTYTAHDREMLALARENQGLRARIQKAYNENESAIQTGVRAAVVAGSAFAVGYLEERYPDRSKVAGVPASLVLAAAGLGSVALGYVPKEHAYMAEAAGLGALAAYGYGQGKTQGASAKKG